MDDFISIPKNQVDDKERELNEISSSDKLIFATVIFGKVFFL